MTDSIDTKKSQDISALNDHLKAVNTKLGEKLKGDCLFIRSDLAPPLENWLQDAAEKMKRASKRKHLIVLLQTEGGPIDLVERLVTIMRHLYEEVSFIVPNYAYSTGTALALSGNRIYMDYSAVLGLLDPQIELAEGKVDSGIAYLDEIERLTKIINATSNKEKCFAERGMLAAIYRPSIVEEINYTIEFARHLLVEWLTTYKFKDWDFTESGGIPVTMHMKRERALEIAKILGDVKFWYSYGRGLSMDKLTGDQIKLRIDDFGCDPELNSLVREYHNAFDYFLNILGIEDCLHSMDNLWGIKMTDNEMNGRSDWKTDESSVPNERGTMNDVAEFAKMLRPFDAGPTLVSPNKPLKRGRSNTAKLPVRKKKITGDDIAEMAKMFRPFAEYPKLIHPFKPIDIEKLKFRQY